MDFTKIEGKWQKKWEKARIFEPKIEKRKKLFMTVPYPYTSGPLHIGHGRTYTLADIWIRYQRMKGLNALWPMAFHITGTPILAVSKKIKAKDEVTIKLYKEYVGLYEKNKKKIDEIVNSFIDPQKVADYFAGVISKDFMALGFSIDWRHSFTTGDKDYNKFIEWQFLSLKNKKLITKGEHPVQFCLFCNNAVGEDDIKDGDTLKTGIQVFTAIKFPFQDGFLVAATLRPETIFGLTNIWVRPDGDYVKARVGGEVWYISATAAEKLKYQNHAIDIIERMKGSNLIGKYAKSPVEDRKVLVLPADIVDVNDVTGVVYSVPAHAPDDWMALYDLKTNMNLSGKYGLNEKEIEKIEPISVISIQGFGNFPSIEICKQMKISSQHEREKLEEATRKIYKAEYYRGILKNNCKQFSGIAIKEIKDEVKEWLKKSKKAFDFFESETPNLKCRDGGDVIVKVLKDQWFINYNDNEWKEKAKQCLDAMTIIPEGYRSMFEATINWLHERACARRRGLGTHLPWDKQWIIESLSDSTIYPAFYLLVHILRKNKIKPQQLKTELFDYVFLEKGTPATVEKKTSVPKKIIKELKEELDYWYPVDERHTAIPHITNHLTFYIFNHAALFPKKYWPRAITLNELLIREGSKMSKSKGNIIPLAEISEKYGADLYRMYMSAGADLDTVIDWTSRNVEMMSKRLNRINELCIDIAKSKPKETEKSNIDTWLLSKFNRIMVDVPALIEQFRLRDYAQLVIFGILNDIVYYYKRAGKRKNYRLLRKIAQDWIKLLAPIVPHTSEELWQKFGNKSFVSVEQWPTGNKKMIDTTAELAEEIISNTLDDIGHIKKLVNIDRPKRLYIYTAPAWKYKLYDTINKITKNNDVEQKKIISEIMKNKEYSKHGKAAIDTINIILKDKRSKILDEKKEFDIIKEATDFLKEECNIKDIKLWKADDPNKADKQDKAQKAEPMKPALYLE